MYCIGIGCKVSAVGKSDSNQICALSKCGNNNSYNNLQEENTVKVFHQLGRFVQLERHVPFFCFYDHILPVDYFFLNGSLHTVQQPI